MITGITSTQVVWVIIWLVLTAISLVSLGVLLATRWGRSKPLRICVVLSLIAHLLLAGYATTIQIGVISIGSADPVIEISFGDELPGTDQASQQEKPWRQYPSQALPVDSIPPPPRRSVKTKPNFVPLSTRVPAAQGVPAVGSVRSAAPVRLASAATPHRFSRPVPAKIHHQELPQIDVASPRRIDNGAPSSETHQLVRSESKDHLFKPTPIASSHITTATPTAVEIPLQFTSPTSSGQETEGESGSADGDSSERAERSPVAGKKEQVAQQKVPDNYQLRTAKDRPQRAGRLGGSPQAELAVKAGLKWLASVQHADGHWDAMRWGAGSQPSLFDHDRKNAGAKAETGITGLALLAFLGSGHTHFIEGPYRDTVRRGLEYLAGRQRRDGNLAGDATLYAAMYCHSMASCALSEAYAMTSDKRLQSYVRRAIHYTLSAQNVRTGGWRYRPGDKGDTSQLGWQVMALKSADLAGLKSPALVNHRVQQYLASVSSGSRGGLASYRPGKSPTPTMTAEALVCRMFSGMSPENPTALEAANYLIKHLPGSQGKRNYYYWYYATLALYQRQDRIWEKWNSALQATLISAQNKQGSFSGSWNPDTVWGNYGGRVYTTAMATLCLEVYYRFLPIYGGRDD
ncbi:MAG: hypothetical protein N2C12_14940 [Planctomycetales bacterium]